LGTKPSDGGQAEIGFAQTKGLPLRRGRRFYRALLLAAGSLMLASCTDAQLSQNTIAAARHVESIYKEQVLANLGRFIDDPDSVPSFADIASGSVQTGGNATISIGIPYGNQVTETVSGGSASAAISQIQLPSKVITPGLTDSWQQSWTVSPITDSNTLRRIRALFVYVTDTSEMADTTLRRNYDITPTLTNDLLLIDSSRLLMPRCVICLRDNSKTRMGYAQSKLNHELDMLGTLYTDVYKNATFQKYTYHNTTAPDATAASDVTKALLPLYASEYSQSSSTGFTEIPVDPDALATSSDFEINRMLRQFRDDLCWAKSGNGGTISSRDVKKCSTNNPAFLGEYSGHNLYLDRPSEASLADFELFLLPNGDTRLPAPPSSGSGASGGSGGGSGSGGSASGGGGSGK